MARNKQDTTLYICDCGHSFYGVNTNGQVRIKRPLNITKRVEIVCGKCNAGLVKANPAYTFLNSVDKSGISNVM